MLTSRILTLSLALVFAGGTSVEAAQRATTRARAAAARAAAAGTQNQVPRGPFWVSGIPFFFFPGIGFVPASQPVNPFFPPEIFNASIFGINTQGFAPSGFGPFSPPTVVAPGRPGAPQIAFDARPNIDPTVVSGTFGFNPFFHNAGFPASPFFTGGFNPFFGGFQPGFGIHPGLATLPAFGGFGGASAPLFSANAGTFFNPGLAGTSTGFDPRFIFRGDIGFDPRRFGVDPRVAVGGFR